MPQMALGGFLVLHGLITVMIGFGTVTDPSATRLASPAWLAWWPGPFGRSWLFEAMHLGSGFQVLGGVVWLTAGLALLGGAIGWLGLAPFESVHAPLLVGGAILGLLALTLYFHPIYLVAVLIDIALITLLWDRIGGAVRP
jgi:hypothetical protein